MVLQIILCYLFVGAIATAIHRNFIFDVIEFGLRTDSRFEKLWAEIGKIGMYIIYKYLLIIWPYIAIVAIRYYVRQMKM